MSANFEKIENALSILSNAKMNLSNLQGSSKNTLPLTPQFSSMTISTNTQDSRNYEDFVARINSYNQTNWCAKPANLTPVHCSQLGWTCVDVGLLKCISCSKYIGGKISKELSLEAVNAIYERFEKKLISGHHPYCSWRSNPFPKSFCCLSFDSPHKAFSTFSESFEKLLSIQKNLPFINFKFNDDIGMDEIQCTNVPISSDSFQELISVLSLAYPQIDEVKYIECSKVAFLLSLYGWKANISTSHQTLTCNFCCRKVGLWNYVSIIDHHNGVQLINEDKQPSNNPILVINNSDPSNEILNNRKENINKLKQLDDFDEKNEESNIENRNQSKNFIEKNIDESDKNDKNLNQSEKITTKNLFEDRDKENNIDQLMNIIEKNIKENDKSNKNLNQSEKINTTSTLENGDKKNNIDQLVNCIEKNIGEIDKIDTNLNQLEKINTTSTFEDGDKENNIVQIKDFILKLVEEDGDNKKSCIQDNLNKCGEIKDISQSDTSFRKRKRSEDKSSEQQFVSQKKIKKCLFDLRNEHQPWCIWLGNILQSDDYDEMKNKRSSLGMKTANIKKPLHVNVIEKLNSNEQSFIMGKQMKECEPSEHVLEEGMQQKIRKFNDYQVYNPQLDFFKALRKALGLKSYNNLNADFNFKSPFSGDRIINSNKETPFKSLFSSLRRSL